MVTPGATSSAAPGSKGIWEAVETEQWARALGACAGMINALAYTPEAHEPDASVLWARTQAVLERAQEVGLRRVVYLSHRVAFGSGDALDEIDEHSRSVPGASEWPLVDALSVNESLHWGALVDELDCVLVGAPLVLGAHAHSVRVGASVARQRPAASFHVAGVEQLARAAGAALERGQRARRYLLRGQVVDAATLTQLCDHVTPEPGADAAWIAGALAPTWASAELQDQPVTPEALAKEVSGIW